MSDFSIFLLNNWSNIYKFVIIYVLFFSLLRLVDCNINVSFNGMEL